MAKLFNGAGSHSNYPDVLFGFQDHLRAKNAEIADSLARNAHSFHRSLCFIGCSIPVLLPTPPRV